MPEDTTPSLPPPEQQELDELRAKDKRTFSIDLDKKVLSTIGAIVTVIAGYGGWQFVTEAQMEEEIAKSEKKQRDHVEEVKTEVTAEVKKNTGAIEGLTASIGDVQQTQHRDIAIREARRVVNEQPRCGRGDDRCRRRRSNDRERIRRTNMKRLKAKMDPCPGLQCNGPPPG